MEAHNWRIDWPDGELDEPVLVRTGVYEESLGQVMTWSSPSPKHANVLVLLNALYTSGFATTSPTVPRLTGKTMHTLYAVSFIVYSTSAFVDWVHTYAVLKGLETSFPLKDWFVVYMVVVSVVGSTLNTLLMVLCVENAFAYRVHVTPYRSGLAVIWEAFVEWLHSFNNFRVAFLFAVLHDLPMTLANFFFIAACRCSGPDVRTWQLTLSTITLLTSLCWRVVMLYFAYRRMVFPERSKNTSALPSRQPSFREHLEQQISFSFDINQNSRLKDFDETWPIRWSISRVYGEYPVKKEAVIYYTEPPTGNRLVGLVETAVCYVAIFISDAVRNLIRRCVCVFLTVALYAACCLTGCVPCLHYYFCRKTSLSRRHKCAKTFVRFSFFTLVFHYAMLLFSVVCTLALIVLNLVLLSSVHTVGPNNLPPEIYQVCHVVDFGERTIAPHLLPQRAGAAPPPHLGRACKSIWETPATRTRPHQGPWQVRLRIDNDTSIAISTHFVWERNGTTDTHVLLYDFLVLDWDRRACAYEAETGWAFGRALPRLPWPYFAACERTVRLERRRLIHCPWPFNPQF